MSDTTFILLMVGYQLFLAGRDFTVTGLMAKDQKPDWKFYAYCIMTTLEVSIVAALANSGEPNQLIGLLKMWTVFLCWCGGLLDWIYFGIRKLVTQEEPPEWSYKWRWMPKIFPYITRGRITFDHPTTKHWAAYTALMWIPNMICWSYVLLT